MFREEQIIPYYKPLSSLMGGSSNFYASALAL